MEKMLPVFFSYIEKTDSKFALEEIENYKCEITEETMNLLSEYHEENKRNKNTLTISINGNDVNMKEVNEEYIKRDEDILDTNIRTTATKFSFKGENVIMTSEGEFKESTSSLQYGGEKSSSFATEPVSKKFKVPAGTTAIDGIQNAEIINEQSLK